MAFVQYSSWEERLLYLQQLKDKCNSILAKLNLPRDDARAHGIIHFRQFCNTLAAVPMKLQQNAEIGSSRQVVMSILGIAKTSDLKSCLNDFNDNSKASFITMAQFAFENCITQVLNAIPGETDQGRFAQTSKRLIEITNIVDPLCKHEILMIPAWIRNTLHAGGIHDKSSKTIIVDGEKYVFEKDKSFSCATWCHCIHIFLNCLDTYEEMLLSNIVASIPTITAR